MGETLLTDRERYQRAFLLVLVAAISMAFVAMVRSFVMTVFMAGIFAGLLTPFHLRLARRLRGHRGLASGVTVAVMLLVVVIPLLALLTLVATEAVRLSESARPWVEQQIRDPGRLLDRLGTLPGIERLEPYRDDILQRLGAAAGSLGGFLVGSLSALTRGTVSFFFHLFLFLYSLFYLLLDGDRVLERILYYMPLPPQWEQRLVGRFVSVARATIKGTLVIGLLQGALAGLGLHVAGIPSALFWSAVMVLLSILPGVGTALVWAPAAVYLFAAGHSGRALVLAAWCAVVVGSIDNVIRPWMVGRDTCMHDLLILFSTLGGLVMFGLVGFVVGPILAALFVTVWDVYGQAFGDVLPPVAEGTTGRSPADAGGAPDGSA